MLRSIYQGKYGILRGVYAICMLVFSIAPAPASGC